MLTPADMERVLESLDRRLTGIEQKLPGLATAAQLEAHRLATAEQLEAHRLATAAQLEAHKVATAAQLEAHKVATAEQLEAHKVATAEQLEALAASTAQGLEDVKQFARSLNEQTNDRIRLVAEGLEHLTRRVDDLPTRQEFRTLSARVDDIGIAVQAIARNVSDVGQGVATLTTRLEARGVI